MLCDIAGVSKSGYFKWCKRKEIPDPDTDNYQLIKKIFTQGRKKLGYRRITMILREQGICMNHKKVWRIMKKYGLKTTIRKRNPYTTIYKIQGGEHTTAPNLLKQQFKRHSPYTFLTTDITYLRYTSKTSYLSVVKDISSGEILAHMVTPMLDISLSVGLVDCLVAKLKKRKVKPEYTMLHSDQGVHYTCRDYRMKLKEIGITQSMSRKGNCLDNAPVESFFGHMKDELDYQHVRNHQEVVKLVDSYIINYNEKRHQWNRKKMTPINYRNHLLSVSR